MIRDVFVALALVFPVLLLLGVLAMQRVEARLDAPPAGGDTVDADPEPEQVR